MLTNLRIMMPLLCCFFYASCTPSGGGASAGRKGSSGSSAAGGGPGSALTGTSTGTAKGGTLDQNSMANMSLADLQKTYDERTAEALSDKQTYSINVQIADLLCSRLAQLRNECISANRLVPGGDSQLSCAVPGGATTTQAATASATAGSPTFTATLADAGGKPLAANALGGTGQFILVANSNYVSDPFGPGDSVPVRFAANAGLKASALAPQIKQIYRLELKRADEKTADILAMGANLNTDASAAPSNATPAAGVMPTKSQFTLVLKFQGITLTSGAFIDYDKPEMKGYRYLVALQGIADNASSAACRVEQPEIDSIKNGVRDSVQTQDSQNQRKALFSHSNGSSLSKDQLEAGILAAQDTIAKFAPTLDDTQNRLLKLTNELRPDVLIGCHADEPISTLTIAVEGKKEDPKDIGNYTTIPTPLLTGSASTLSFAMGSSVTINIDQDKYGVVGGSPWSGTVGDAALVGDIQYLRISKLGINWDGDQTCTSGPLGFDGKCAFDVHEGNIFTIAGVTITIDTPSVKGRIIYENHSLNFTLASTRYSDKAVMSWTEDNFRANENWVKLMQDTNCDTQK